MEWQYLLIGLFYFMIGYGVASGLAIKIKMRWIDWITNILIWPTVLIGLIVIKLIK